MWRHPITAKQIRVLAEDWGIKEPATGEGEATSLPDPSGSEGWFQVVKVVTPAFILSLPKLPFLDLVD